jgi:hypothetical protein
MAYIRLREPDSHIGYSPLERKIFDLLPSVGKRISTKELTKKIYGSKVPINGRVIISGTLRNLIKKTLKNKEPFKIASSGQRGPHSIEVWLE